MSVRKLPEGRAVAAYSPFAGAWLSCLVACTERQYLSLAIASQQQGLAHD